jgi:hypothetical protein
VNWINWDDSRIRERAEKAAHSAVGMAVSWAHGEAYKKLNIGNAQGDNPSAPEQYPHKVSGHLQAAIGWQVIKSGKLYIGRFGLREGRLTKDEDGNDYALVHEFGGKSRAARPYIRPTILNNEKKLGNIIKNRFKEVFGG